MRAASTVAGPSLLIALALAACSSSGGGSGTGGSGGAGAGGQAGSAAGSGNFAYIKETKTFPATNNVLYGRMFVWFEDALTTDGHFTLAEGAGTGTPAVIRFGGQFKAFGVGTDGGNSGDWTDSDRTM